MMKNIFLWNIYLILIVKKIKINDVFAKNKILFRLK